MTILTLLSHCPITWLKSGCSLLGSQSLRDESWWQGIYGTGESGWRAPHEEFKSAESFQVGIRDQGQCCRGQHAHQGRSHRSLLSPFIPSSLVRATEDLGSYGRTPVFLCTNRLFFCRLNLKTIWRCYFWCKTIKKEEEHYIFWCCPKVNALQFCMLKRDGLIINSSITEVQSLSRMCLTEGRKFQKRTAGKGRGRNLANSTCKWVVPATK